MERKPSQHSTCSSSNSNTDSGSGAPAAADLELNLDKDIPLLDLECLIQSERIAHLLERSIYKTKLSLCLPMLLIQERQSLATIMHPQDLKQVSFIFEKYVNILNSSSLMNAKALEDIEMGDFSLKHRLNPELAHLLYILDKYKELGPKVEAIMQDMKLKRHTKNEKDLPKGFNYLVHLELFFRHVTIWNQTKAADEPRALQTKKLEESNKKLVERIKKYEDAIINEKKAFEMVLKEKKELIRQMELKLSKVHHTSVAILKEKVLDSDRQMVFHSRALKVRRQMMLEEVNESREAYKHVLNKDITEENSHRHRRRKLEAQVKSWVQKYDTDMTEKQAELDEMCDMYEDEAAKIQDLELKLEEQDAEYQKLMKERDDEYHEELTEKMNVFVVSHAARVVQMAWRDVLANRDEKRKLGNILKKRKEAEEAAERAAKIRAKKEAAAAKKKAADEKKAAAAAKKQARDEMKAIKKAEIEAKRATK